MSYRLITRAALTVNANTVEVEFRAYPLPKTAAKLPLTIEGAESTFQLTGGKGRGDTVKAYMYAIVKETPCFALIPSEFHAAMKAGKSVVVNLPVVVPTVEQTIAAIPAEPMAQEATQESPEGIADLAPVEEPVKKASRRSRTAKAVA